MDLAVKPQNKTKQKQNKQKTLAYYIVSFVAQKLLELTNEPRHEGLGIGGGGGGGVRPGKTHTSLLSHRDKLESWNFGYSK